MKRAIVLCGVAIIACQLRANAQPFAPAVQNAPGITVFGRASARVPADILRFSARLTLRPVSIEALSTQVQTVTSAIKRAGAQQVSSDVGPLYAPSQGLNLSVNGSFPAIPFDRVLGATQSVVTSLQNMSGATLQSVNAVYALRDCEAAASQIRRNAIEDARRRAQAIAQAQNLRLGPVIHDTETAPACVELPNEFVNGALEATASPTVLLTVSESVTYAILAK